MLLGYHEPKPSEDGYHFGKINGVDKKFARVVAGVILPLYERQAGAVVVLGELFQSFKPMDLTGLAAAVGEYDEIENALREFDRDLQFRDCVLESDELRALIWKIPTLSLKVLTASAPKYAFSEIGRQKVNKMIDEGKLHLELIEDKLAAGEPEVSAKAVHAAVCWMQEYPHLYRSAARKRQQPEAHPLGTRGL